jgi:hypothetical protein
MAITLQGRCPVSHGFGRGDMIQAEPTGISNRKYENQE